MNKYLMDNNFFYNRLVEDLIFKIQNRKTGSFSFYVDWPYDRELESFKLKYKTVRSDDIDYHGECSADDYGQMQVSILFCGTKNKTEIPCLANVLAHEIHHLTQTGDYKIKKRYKIPTYDDDTFDYFCEPCEVEAFLIGFRAESYYSGYSVDKCIDNYLLDYIKYAYITIEQSEIVKDLWLNCFKGE